jgi:hypothetical protein
MSMSAGRKIIGLRAATLVVAAAGVLIAVGPCGIASANSPRLALYEQVRPYVSSDIFSISCKEAERQQAERTCHYRYLECKRQFPGSDQKAEKMCRSGYDACLREPCLD